MKIHTEEDFLLIAFRFLSSGKGNGRKIINPALQVKTARHSMQSDFFRWNIKCPTVTMQIKVCQQYFYMVM